MNTTPKADLYTFPHKEFRKMLFKVSDLAANIDEQSGESVTELKESVLQLVATLESHAHHEETFIHPIMLEKGISGVGEIEKEHKKLEKDLKNLKDMSECMQGNSIDFYRFLNRFIASYLMHLDEEECISLPALHEKCTHDELENIMTSFLVSQGDSQAFIAFTQTLPKLSSIEQERLCKGILVNSDPDTLKMLYKELPDFIGNK